MRKRTIATLATAAALALGVIGTQAYAETPPPSAPPSGQPQAPKPATGSNTEAQEPKINGTVPAPKEAAGAPEASEANESAALAALAKVSEADARNAALAKFPGATITKAELGDENGFVVWSIELTDASKAPQEVKVDAGSGAVLAVEAGGADNEKAGKSGTDTD